MEPSISPPVDGGMTRRVNPEDISLDVGGDKKTIVLFEMSTCPYCRMFEGRFDDFARTRSHEYDFLRVILNDAANPLWQRYGLRAVPTVIVFAAGRIVSRLDSVIFLGITKKNWSEFSAGL